MWPRFFWDPLQSLSPFKRSSKNLPNEVNGAAAFALDQLLGRLPLSLHSPEDAQEEVGNSVRRVQFFMRSFRKIEARSGFPTSPGKCPAEGVLCHTMSMRSGSLSVEFVEREERWVHFSRSPRKGNASDCQSRTLSLASWHFGAFSFLCLVFLENSFLIPLCLTMQNSTVPLD